MRPGINRVAAFLVCPPVMETLTVLACLLLAFLLGGCAATPGIVPGIGGRTVIEREFADSDSHYTESIKAPAGVDASQLSKFSLKLEEDGLKYEVGLDSDGTVDTSKQAALLAQVSRDSLEALRSALRTLEALAAPVPEPSPISVPITLKDGVP